MYTSNLVEPEDVSQEVALITLEKGVTPSKSIVYRKLSRQAFEQLNVYDLLSNSSDEDWADPLESLASVGIQPEGSWSKSHEDLVAWALEQTAEVQACIGHFMEDPEANIEETLYSLAALEVIELPPSTASKSFSKTVPLSYAQILRQRLPATVDELIHELSYYPIRRPAATVRQFLRRNSNQLVDHEGLICLEDSHGDYGVTGKA